MTAPRYTISILAHNHLALTQACLRSVSQHSTDCEVIVTDNGSTDGTGAYLTDYAAKNKELVRLITNPTNQGFKDPNNHALTLAKGEYLVLLNNDMTVCEGWLEKLAAPFDADPKLAITGIANTCQSISKELVGSYGGALEYIEGGCMMTPVVLARKHGLFSPYLRFAYWEDTDYSFRLRELGYNIATVPLAINHAKRGSTSSTVPGIRDYLAANTEAMKERFGFYFKRREMKRRILVRRLGAHGDVLLATPALWALREKYPLADIHVQTKCPAMLHGLDWVSVVTRPRSWYDRFYDLDLAYEKRPEVHIVQAFADVLQVRLPARWQLHMAATPEDMAWGARQTRGLKAALVHAGPTCWPGKNWVLSRFEELVGALKGKGYFVVSVGGADAPDIGADLNLAGQTTPQQLYALCEFSSLFVGIDSMPQHLASSADTPSVVLFGPTNPRAIIRPTPRVVFVQADQAKVSCVGEHGRRTKPLTQAPCDGKCMEAITLEMVLKGIARAEAFQ